MKELVAKYLNTNYIIKEGIIKDKSNDEVVSYYYLIGSTWKIFGKTNLVNKCCKDFIKK